MDPQRNQDVLHEQSKARMMERARAIEAVQRGEEPWARHVGVISVADAVRDLRFPATVDDILEQAGDRDVRTSQDVRLPLAYILPKLPQETFASVREFERVVAKHWRGIETLEVPQDARSPPQTMPPGVDVE